MEATVGVEDGDWVRVSQQRPEAISGATEEIVRPLVAERLDDGREPQELGSVGFRRVHSGRVELPVAGVPLVAIVDE